MSSLNSQSFVNRNAAFLIKLTLVGLEAAPQIRRVHLKSITTNGVVSYEKLISLAIQFTFPSSSAEQRIAGFDVTITYYDTDNDCITLSTVEELMDAIKQYCGVGTLRLTTDVRKKESQHSS